MTATMTELEKEQNLVESPHVPPCSLDELCNHCGNKIAYDVTGTGYCIVCGKRIC